MAAASMFFLWRMVEFVHIVCEKYGAPSAAKRRVQATFAMADVPEPVGKKPKLMSNHSTNRIGPLQLTVCYFSL